jgi:hypothetical protein
MFKVEEPLLLTASSGSNVSIQIQGVPTGQGVLINYITNPANCPKSFGNHIYVWQTTSNIVPWDKVPDGDSPVNSDSSTSTQQVNFAFENKGYIIGYAVAPSPMAVCATIYMPAGQQTNPGAWEYANLTLSTVYVGTNLVQVRYQGLNSYTPATNKNWLGLWQGGNVPYASDPKKAIVIPTNDQSGYPVIEGVTLLINTTYSVGYFMVERSTGRTSLSASTTFTVGTSPELIAASAAHHKH